MTYRLAATALLSLAVAGCAGDDDGDTTTSVGDGPGTTGAATTTAGMTTASPGTTTDDTSSTGGDEDSDSGEGTESGDGTSATTGAMATTDGGSATETGGEQTECGGESCDTATEICVERAKGGPSSFGCEPVPDGCDADRTCGCVGVPLCTVGLMDCTDVADNQVFCDSGLD